MMKILCISNYYPPFFEGGYEISVAESMAWLAARGHSIYVLCGNKGVSNPADFLELNFTADPIQRCLKYINYTKASFWNKHQVEAHNYRLTLQACELIKPDLVYLGNQKAISIAAALAVQRLNIARVYDIGDDWLRTYCSPGIKGRLFRFLKEKLPFLIGGKVQLDPVLVPSLWMADELRQKYGSKNVHVIPRAIALPEPNMRELGHPLRFIFAGRIEPFKGLDLLVEATRLLQADYPHFQVDIYGEEDAMYADNLRKQIEEYGLMRHLKFMGKSQQLASILPAYDVLLMPTMARETFGRVIIEAMAASLIVIATNAYGPAEIIEHQVDSYLFKRGSAVALAQCIQTVLTSDLKVLERMRLNARQKVATHYEISLVKKSIENMLESELKNILDKRGKDEKS